MIELLEIAKQIGDSDIPVLITGETGTGKELMADYIHKKSTRNKEILIKINCAAIPDSLIESEFFGHLKGSFTGSTINKTGIFEQSDKGTLFLDEIGDLSESAQAKILRVLQEKKIKKVGSVKEIGVDFRIISATNRNLLNDNSFRDDLYYRINGIIIDIPPLRQRKCDIEILVNYFISKFSNELKREKPSVGSNVLNILLNHNWPGNIRELEHLIKKSLLLSNGVLEIKDNIGTGKRIKLDTYNLEENEINLILMALEKTDYRQKKASELLGVTPRVLNFKIKTYGITHPNWHKNNGIIN